MRFNFFVGPDVPCVGCVNRLGIRFKCYENSVPPLMSMFVPVMKAD